MPWRSAGSALGEPQGQIDREGREWASGWRPPFLRSAFRRTVLAQLDAAYNFARWLVGADDDAEEVVNEAMARALARPHHFHDGEAGAWVLGWVRGVAYARLGIETASAEADRPPPPEPSLGNLTPAALLEAVQPPGRLNALLERLPIELRECLVLCELHGAGYREIAAIVDIEVDAVRSRLWRGRRLLVRLAADLADNPPETRE